MKIWSMLDALKYKLAGLDWNNLFIKVSDDDYF